MRMSSPGCCFRLLNRVDDVVLEQCAVPLERLLHRRRGDELGEAVIRSVKGAPDLNGQEATTSS